MADQALNPAREKNHPQFKIPPPGTPHAAAMELKIVGGRLWIFGSKWTLELYLMGWQPEAARLFRASESFSRVRGLSGEETRIVFEGIRPQCEFEVIAGADTHASEGGGLAG